MNKEIVKSVLSDLIAATEAVIGTEKTEFPGMQDYLVIGDEVNHAIDMMEKAKTLIKESKMFEIALNVQYLDSYDVSWGELAFAKDGDACFDLRITEEVVLYPGRVELVGTGIKTEFPNKFVLHIYPRSGTACKKHVTLANAPATIDSGYRGEIKLGLLNVSQDLVKLNRGERVAQARLCNLVPTIILKAESLTETSRGENGFGSTGTK